MFENDTCLQYTWQKCQWASHITQCLSVSLITLRNVSLMDKSQQQQQFTERSLMVLFHACSYLSIDSKWLSILTSTRLASYHLWGAFYIFFFSTSDQNSCLFFIYLFIVTLIICLMPLDRTYVGGHMYVCMLISNALQYIVWNSICHLPKTSIHKIDIRLDFENNLCLHCGAKIYHNAISWFSHVSWNIDEHQIMFGECCRNNMFVSMKYDSLKRVNTSW